MDRARRRASARRRSRSSSRSRSTRSGSRSRRDSRDRGSDRFVCLFVFSTIMVRAGRAITRTVELLKPLYRDMRLFDDVQWCTRGIRYTQCFRRVCVGAYTSVSEVWMGPLGSILQNQIVRWTRSIFSQSDAGRSASAQKNNRCVFGAMLFLCLLFGRPHPPLCLGQKNFSLGGDEKKQKRRAVVATVVMDNEGKVVQGGDDTWEFQMITI